MATDLELVLRAEPIILDALEREESKNADQLEKITKAQDPELDRQITGLAVLRLLNQKKIVLCDDFRFRLVEEPARRG